MNFGYRSQFTQPVVKETSRNISTVLLPFHFLKSLILYFVLRTRQFFMFAYAFIITFGAFLGELKSWSIRKMFWGRSSFYKNAIHGFVGIFTLIITITGISARLDIFRNNAGGLVLASGIIGSNDILLQEGTLESIVPSDPNQLGYQVYKHTVERGETLSSIADDYGISIDTIKWANNISASSSTLAVGQVLDIPEIDGVLYTVKKGDSVSKVAKVTKGNEIDILELNNIDADNPILSEGQKLFVPFGSIEPPVIKKAGVARTGTYISGPATGINIPVGTFIRPLPEWCGKWTRGFTYYHGGVDVAQAGGCWERAAAPGTVIIAGYRGAGQGYMVEIDHGKINGKSVHTRYYHGNGNYRVRPGDHVAAGQDIMFMGCTGNCTGTHLHFEVVVDDKKVNPENYVKLR